MMRKTFLWLNRRIGNMHNAAYLLAVFAILSVLLALIRDKLLAHVFGAGIELDLYYAAFRVPDLIYATVASMASVFVLVPILANKSTDKSKQDFIHVLLAVFGGILILISLIVYILMPVLVTLLFSELTVRGYADELVSLSRILLLQPVLLGLSSIVSSVIQYYGKYIIYAIAPLLYNFGIIAGILFFVPKFGISGLGYGVLMGAFFHLLVQLPGFAELGFGRRFNFISFQEVINVIKISLPRTAALFANQIAIFALVVMAGSMSEGSIAIFTLAFNLQSAPLSVIGASYSTAAFPTLSKLYAGKKHLEFANQISAALRHIIFWSLPAMTLIFVLRAHIVRVIYGSGAFNWDDTRLTAAALALFTLSLVAQCAILLFIRAYYATGRTAKPLILSIFSAIITVIMAKIMTQTYAENEFLRNFFEILTRTSNSGDTSVLVLPFVYSMSAIITAIAFTLLFAMDFRDSARKILNTLFESLVGAFFAGGGAYLFLYIVSELGLFSINTFLGVFMQGVLAGTAGIAMGATALIMIGNKEILTAKQILSDKFAKVG